MNTFKILLCLVLLTTSSNAVFAQNKTKNKLKFGTTNVRNIEWNNASVDFGKMNKGNVSQKIWHFNLTNTGANSLNNIEVVSSNPIVKVMAITKTDLKPRESCVIEFIIDNDSATPINTKLSLKSAQNNVEIHLTGAVL